MLDIRRVHEAAAILHARQFWDVDFQPFEAHLIGLQFIADLNLRGMDYLWAPEKHVVGHDRKVVPSSGGRRRPVHIVCDTRPVHCHRDSILNQHLTTVCPDDELDAMALATSTRVITLVDGNVVAERQVTEGRIVSASLDFPIDVRDRNLGWMPQDAPTVEAGVPQHIVCWEDPWPADFDDPHAPPVGSSLEEMWIEEEQRRIQKGLSKPASLYERRNEAGFKRKVQHVAEMIEPSARETLRRELGWTFPPDLACYASEQDITREGMEGHVPGLSQGRPEVQSPVPIPTHALPIATETADVAATALKAAARVRQRNIELLDPSSPSRPPGDAILGLSQFAADVMPQLGQDRLLYYAVAPPTPPPRGSATRRKRPRGPEPVASLGTTALRMLDVSMDGAGRLVLKARRVESSGDTEPVTEGQTSSSAEASQIEERAVAVSKSQSSSSSDSIEILPSIDAVSSKRKTGFLQLLQNIRVARRSRRPVPHCSPRPVPKRTQPSLLELYPARLPNAPLPPSYSTPTRSSADASSSPRHMSPPARVASTKRESPVVRKPETSPLLTKALGQVGTSTSQYGLRMGRILGLEALSQLSFPTGHQLFSVEPRTFRQAKQAIPDARTCPIVAIVYICRIDISPEVSRESQIQRLHERLPEGSTAAVDYALRHLTSEMDHHVDVPGVVFVNAASTSNWDTVDVPLTHEQYQEKSGAATFLSSNIASREGITLGPHVIQHHVPTEFDLVVWVMHRLFRVYDPVLIVGFDTFTGSIG